VLHLLNHEESLSMPQASAVPFAVTAWEPDGPSRRKSEMHWWEMTQLITHTKD
jgi:hypothetical protein